MKRLIVCCDGTWNAPEKLEPDVRPATNVLKMSRAILPKDGRGIIQVVEYVRGIGTGNLLDRWIGGASGKGITSNILQAYQFISNNFQPGDHIYLFGFSRGAYTARSLSGFINYFGILRKEYQDQLPYIYDLYQRTAKPNLPELVAGYAPLIDRDLETIVDREEERHCIPIHFLGVWDTVGALGAPIGLIRNMFNDRIAFHDTELAPVVTYGYHALALHEYREDFAPTLWTVKRSRQKVEQVWFPGTHSDVGGGLRDTGLSDVAFQWLAEKAMSVGLGMNQSYLSRRRPNPLVPVTNSRTGIYRRRPPYVRPIGPSYRDNYKPISIEEFRHVSVDYRLANMSANIRQNLVGHEREADNRSQHPTLPLAPVP